MQTVVSIDGNFAGVVEDWMFLVKDVKRQFVPSQSEEYLGFAHGQALDDGCLLSAIPSLFQLELRRRKIAEPLSAPVNSSHSAALTELSIPVMVGNVAWWLGSDAPSEKSHRWCVYVRSPANEDLTSVVESVTFTLHETFLNNVRTVSRAPFELTEYGWGEFVVGIVIKLHAVPTPIEMTHLLQFSTRPRPPHAIPPLGRTSFRDDPIPYTLSPMPCASENYDELVVVNPPFSLVDAVRGLQVRPGCGVSCYEEIKKYAPRQVPDDLASLSVIRNTLHQAVQHLHVEVSSIGLSSVRLR